MTVTAEPDRWYLATLAVAALAVDPHGLHGIVVRDRPGPVRDAIARMATELLALPVRRLPGTLETSALSGGLDLGETLRSGHAVTGQGLIERAKGCLLVVPMAERMEAGVAAMLAGALDAVDAPPMLLLDEGAEPDETVPEALSDRIAMELALEGMPRSVISEAPFGPEQIRAAKSRFAGEIEDAEAIDALTRLATAMAIPSLRVPLMAARLARVLAALEDADTVGEAHIAAATALCLVPKARVMPSAEAPEEDSSPPPPEEQQDDKSERDAQSNRDGALEDRVMDTVVAMLPELAFAMQRQRGRASASGAGERKRSGSHGRPVRSRPGKPQCKRLDVFATLLAAAPWQPLRRKGNPEREGLIVLPEDFRIKQFERPAESVLIFLVDASGSQAAARMAEAKGAVELMLSEAYRRREKVALIAFRGTGAELILPPTRSLLQAKRRLAVLPGGGPTPLASALVAGRELAGQMQRRGATPYLVLLTDGRGNVALSGEPGRAEAKDDAESAARVLAGEGLASVLIDTANRPQKDAQALARMMDARYLPLPRADARGISRSVRASLEA